MQQEIRTICKCRVCGSLNVTYLCDTYNEHSKTEHISNYICTDCGSVFVGNDIDSEELRVAYSTIDTTSYYEEIEIENRKKMVKAIDDLNLLISKDESIIDVGTGNGSFLEMLHEAGFNNVSAHEIQGVDLSDVKDITSHIFLDFDYSSIPSDTFCAVTLLDVAEHVLDPKYLMDMCAHTKR